MTAAKFNGMQALRQQTRTMLLGRTALCSVLSIAVAAALAPRPAKAEPAGGTVVHGGASIQTSGSHTQINQSTQTAVINWQDFSIGSAESVTFAQPNTRSVALNKVMSNIPSDIQGQLTANGQVWIINPNGVYVGRDAAINVGGLVASTADLVQQDWDAGKYTLNGAPAGSEVNIAGAVTATDGSIVLVAPVVDVSGSLTARGDVALGAGSGFAVDFVGDGLTRFAVDEAAGARLNVSGTITAQGGAAFLAASATDAVRESVVSVGGQVEATRIEERGGVIVISGGDTGITEISGTVSASQVEGAGGNVTITGGRVALTDTARVSADGATDGGSVQIGGAFQGGALSSDVVAHSGAPVEAPLPTAKRTYVAAGAEISADAGAAGDGGTVIVWADEVTAFHGGLTATGGAQRGDGGFAEVSGKEMLDFYGTADLSAAQGAMGELLLDPNNIVIVAAGASDALLSGNAVLFNEPDTLTDVSISAGALNSNADITLQASGQIFVNAPIVNLGTGGLTFEAVSGIAINQNILSSGFLNFFGNSGGAGSVTMAAGTGILGTDISVTGSTVTLNVVSASQGLTVTAGDVNLLGGGVTATDGVTITSTGGIGFGATAVGGFQLTDAEGDLIGSDLALIANGGVTLDAISFANSLSVTGSDFTVASNITVSGADGINFFRANDSGGSSVFGGAGGILNDTEIGRINASSLGYFDNDGAINIQDAVAVTGFDTVTLGGTEIDVEDGDDGDSLSVGPGVLVLENTAGDAIQLGGNESGGSGNFVLSNDDLDWITAGTLGVKTTGGTVTFTDTPGAGVDPNFSGFDVLSVEAADIDIEAGVEVSVGTDAAGEFSVTHASPAGNITLGATGGLSLSGAELDRINAATITANTTSGTINVVEIEFTGADEPNTMNLNAPSGLVTFSDASGGTELVEGLTEINISAADVNIDTAITIDVGTGNFNLANSQGDTITLGASDATPGTFDLSGAEMDRIDAATLTATTAADIVLSGASADNAATLVLNAGTVIAVNGASSLDNDLVMNPGTGITQTAALTVGGTTDINAVGLTVTLDNDENDFAGAVDVEATTASLDDTNSIVLGDVDVTTLTVEADNNITDSGATIAGTGVNAAGQTTLTAGGNITLNDAVNDFVGAVAASGQTLSLRDANSIVLGNVAAGNGLTVQADGAGTITQAAATSITAGGTTDLIATGSLITLDNTGNNFAEIDAQGSNVTLRDISAIVLDDVTVTGNLAVNAGGSITDADGTIDVQGTTNLTAFDGFLNWFDIVLDNGNHDFDSDGSGDGLTASGEDITLSEAGNLILGSLTLHAGDLFADGTVAGNSGALSATATGNGNITQTAALTVPGAATFTATGNNVTLTNAANNFLGQVNVSANDVNLTDANSITLGDIDAAGNLIVTSTTGSIDDGAAVAAGSNVNVTGTTTLMATLGNITLNDGTNDFGGAVSAAGLAVSLSDDNTITLADIDAASLSVDADDGIDDGADGMVAGGEINVTGTSSFFTAGAVILDDTVNDFGGAVSAFGTEITLTDANLLTTSLIGAGGNLTLTSTDLNITAAMNANNIRIVNSAPNTLLELGPGLFVNSYLITDAEADLIGGPGALGGHVTIESTGNGQIVVSGVTFNAAPDVQNVTLDTTSGNGSIFFNGTNSFEGDLTVNSGNGIQEFTIGGLDSLSVAGALNMNAPGTISVNFNTNDFIGPVNVSGGNIFLSDSNNITLGDIDATGNLTVTAGTFILDSGATELGAGIDVGGNTTLTAGMGFNVTVDDAVNTFGGVFNASGANISVRDTTSLDLGDIDATSTFTAVSAGAISDGASAGAGADINVSGITTLDAVTTITLDDTTNNFGGAVHARGTDVSLADADSIVLGDIDASGSLTVLAVTGSIGDGNPGDNIWGGPASLDLTVGTTTNLTAGTTITANDANNNFGGAVSASGTNIALVDANSLQLGVIDANGSLSATALSGSLTDTAGQKIDVQGATSLAATGSVALDNAALHDFDSDTTGDAVTASGAGIAIVDANAVTLTGLLSSNGIAVTGGGAVSLSNSTASNGDIGVSSGGAATINGATASNGNISVTSGDLVSMMNSAAGDDITVGAATSATLGNITAGGNLDVTAGSGAAQISNSSVSGDLTVDAGTSATLASVGVSGALDVTATTGFASIENSGVTGDITVDAGTSASMDSVGAGGSVDILTGSNFIVVTNSGISEDLTISAGGDGVGLDEIAVGGDLGIDANGVLILGEVAVSGNLEATTQGTVTDLAGQEISVAGSATITAGGPGNYFDVVLDNPGATGASGSINSGGAQPGPGMHDFGSLNVTGEDIVIRDRNAITITAAGNTDGTPDTTINGNYDIDIDIGSSVHTATMSPNGSVMIQAVGDISIQKVTAGQDALLTTRGNLIILPENPVVAPAGNIPVHTDDGDIWLVALNGGFKYWDPAGLDALYAGASPGTSSLPGADNLIPAGTMFDAPQGNIAIIVNDAFKVLLTSGNTPIVDPLAPTEPPDADPGMPGNQALDSSTYDNSGFVLNTARDGLALISVKDGEITIGSAPIIEGTLVEGGAFQALGALGSLSSSFSDLFVATGNLALESRNTLRPLFPSDPAVSFIVENTASSIGSGAGTRVIGATYVGGFWENIGVFGAFNGIQGQTAAGGGFLTNGVNSPAPGNGRDLLRSPEAITLLTGLVPFTINPNNTANGCIIGGGLCQPIGRVLLLLDVEDGSLLAFRFEDDEEEEDDQFSNRGDEEDWQ